MSESTATRRLSPRAVVLPLVALLAAAFLLAISPVADRAAHAAQSPVGGKISRSEVMARARDWLAQNVQYSQTSYHLDPSGTKTYRQDCSGFVSMAWHLSSSRTTFTLPAVATKIAKSNLRPGDILDDVVHHTVVFEKWANSAHTEFWVIQEANPTDDMLHNVWTLSAHKGFTAYRYNKIVNDGTSSNPNPYSLRQICGAGYYIIDIHSLGSASIFLTWNASAKKNCVATLVHNVHGSHSLGATLAVQGGSSGADNGTYSSYAGPVRKLAASACVKWGGHYRSTSWTSAWSHCG